MKDDPVLQKLVEDIGGLLDGHNNATAVHALISCLAVMLIMSAPPDKRNKALVFIIKTLRDMVKSGTNAERITMQ
jgi:hypothetical protein